jgi:FMN phosphatase YigB (HAD superfamily)
VTLRGVLLDSGDTRIGPRGGRWNPRFDFEAVLTAWHPEVATTAFGAAFAAGDAFLASGVASSRADYHRVVLGALGFDDPPAALLDELEKPRPAVELVEVFPDVEPALDALKAAAVPVVVVTDNWSTIRGLYADLELSAFIEAFVISEP